MTSDAVTGDAVTAATVARERVVLLPERIARRERTARSPGRIASLAGATMGTTWSVKLALAEREDERAIHPAIEAELALVIAQMSTWEPGSVISRFNCAPAGSWHELPHEFFAVLEAALALAERTGGAFDPTVARAVDAWGFGPPGPRSGRPTPAEQREAHAAIGWRRIVLDRAGRRALQPGGIAVDLSAIAKGFAVDQVARRLERLGVPDHLVEIGGELRGAGTKPDGTPWWVELEWPADATRGETHDAQPLVALHGLSVATSGDYRRVHEADGRRFGHTLDPRTGAPLTHDLAAVTVIAGDCMTADALATALLVLGPEAGVAYAEANRVAARFVARADANPEGTLTSALRAMLG